MDLSLLHPDLQEPADLQNALTSTLRKHFLFVEYSGIIKQGELLTLGMDDWEVSWVLWLSEAYLRDCSAECLMQEGIKMDTVKILEIPDTDKGFLDAGFDFKN